MDRRKLLQCAGLSVIGPLSSSVRARSGGTSVDINAAEATRRSVHEINADNELLQGVWDIHIHAAPDISPRTIDEYTLCSRARELGYGGVMLKSNVWACHDRAFLLNKAFPDFACYGSLVLNLAFGTTINVYAVREALVTDGGLCRCIWMPTQNAAYPQSAEPGHTGPVIPVTDSDGRLLPEVVKVMELCAERDIIFATGHSSPLESLLMAKTAKDIGVRKFVITHANSRIWKFTPGQIEEALKFEAWIEFCYLPRLWGPGTGLPKMPRQTIEEFVRYVTFAPERSFVSSDLGSMGLPDPIDGMRQCIQELLGVGVSHETVDKLVRRNPAFLVERS